MPENTNPHNATGDHGHASEIDFLVDGESMTVEDSHQTASSILVLVGLDPALYDLGKLHGEGQPYKDDQQVIVKSGDQFVTIRQSAPVA